MSSVFQNAKSARKSSKKGNANVRGQVSLLQRSRCYVRLEALEKIRAFYTDTSTS